MIRQDTGGRRRAATRLVLTLGFVSLLVDLVYEGARSIAGPYLGFLGANATTVGIIAGAGELAGFTLRLASGRWSDRSGRYWAFTIGGYLLTLVAVPALAFAAGWPVAAGLIVAERLGKGIRSPARDAIISDASDTGQHGRMFGLHEAIDQVGAVLSPLALALLILRGGSYREAFLFLAIPALPALALLLYARRQHERLPHSQHDPKSVIGRGFTRTYWLYVAGAALVAAAFADFALIGYHLQNANIVAPGWIPAYYAAAMLVDALTAIPLGHLYDRAGLRIVPALVGLVCVAPILLFLGNAWVAFIGALVWGLGMGITEGVLRAGLATLAPAGRVGTAFGTYHLVFGVAWFVGSALMGLLYDANRGWLVAFSTLATLAGAAAFVRASNQEQSIRCSLSGGRPR